MTNQSSRQISTQNARTLKTYSELMTLPTFEGRFEYVLENGQIGFDTFGFDRWLNQVLYTSPEWKSFRRYMIVRDDGLDLACPDHPIAGRIIVHHLNPLTPDDVINRHPCIFDPENVICVSDFTHKALHYGGLDYLEKFKIEDRQPNDTCPWRKEK